MHLGLCPLASDVGGMHPASEAGMLYEELGLDKGAADEAYQNPGA